MLIHAEEDGNKETALLLYCCISGHDSKNYQEKCKALISFLQFLFHGASCVSFLKKNLASKIENKDKKDRREKRKGDSRSLNFSQREVDVVRERRKLTC